MKEIIIKGIGLLLILWAALIEFLEFGDNPELATTLVWWGLAAYLIGDLTKE